MQWLRDRLRSSRPFPARRVALRYGAALAAIAAVTVVLSPARTRLELVTIALLYLLLVVVVAARWGWGPGLFTSVVANLSFNFFFVPPLYRFTVQALENAVALLVFLVVAALTSALLARARAGEAAARRRQEETAILYDLSRMIIIDPDAAATLTAICERVRETFGVESCAVLLPVEDALEVAARAGPPMTGMLTAYERRAAEEALAGGGPVFLDAERGRARPRIVGMRERDRRAPVAYLPLRVGAASIGLLQIVGRIQQPAFTDDDVRLLEAFADEAALASDRNRLLREAARVEALAEADRLKSALLSAVSHDLRTPLASIKASASSLLQSDVEWDAETRREFLTAIDEETDRLTGLVSNLLDLSRIEGGALRPDKDWYDVGELLDTVTGRLRRTVQDHEITLDVAPDTGVAPLDYVQIGQVVTNLVENAAKFAPAGTAIAVAARRLGDDAEISVVDQGPGIPAAERELVFEKFYRIARSGPRAPGTGLGLAVSKGLVEAHGGRIRVEDAPGGGARFVVTLPAPAGVPGFEFRALGPADSRDSELETQHPRQRSGR